MFAPCIRTMIRAGCCDLQKDMVQNAASWRRNQLSFLDYKHTIVMVKVNALKTENHPKRGAKGRTETRYRKWLGQVTENAIENALKLQAESARLVHVVDTQSCGGAICSNSLIFPLASILQGQKNSASSSRSRSWTLAKDSEDRRQVAAKIYTLLLQWRSDVSFETNDRLSAAASILEEALYQEAKSRDEYTNPLLLHLRLRRVLCHFEAGNGLFLLQGSSPLYPVRTYRTLPEDPCSSDSSLHVIPAMPVGPNILAQVAADKKEEEGDDSLVWERVNLKLKGTVHTLMTSEMRASRKKEADCALLDAVGSGHKRLMERSLHKHGQYASKKIVRRVLTMISRKKMEESKRLKHDLRKSIPAEKPENSLTANREPPSTEARRHRSGKTLGDMLKFGHRRLEESPRTPDAEGPVCASSQVLELEASLANNCRFQSQTARYESVAGNNLEMQDDEPLQDGRAAGSASSFINSFGVAAKSATKEQRDFTLASGNSLQSFDNASATSADKVARAEHSDCNVVSTSYPATIITEIAQAEQSDCNIASTSYSATIITEIAQAEQSDCNIASASYPTTIITEIVAKAEKNDLTRSSSSAEQALTTNSDIGAKEEYGPSAISSVSGPATEGQEQAARAAETQSSSEPQETTRPTEEESATGGPSSSRARGRGKRIPLIRLLRESGDYNRFHMESISCDYAPWDSWEEPTEELDPLCCVCMVGLKGAAFIPCGHTFCRKCSRELWRGRGTCPLCNRFIREILDIY